MSGYVILLASVSPLYGVSFGSGGLGLGPPTWELGTLFVAVLLQVAARAALPSCRAQGPCPGCSSRCRELEERAASTPPCPIQPGRARVSPRPGHGTCGASVWGQLPCWAYGASQYGA